MIDMRARVVSSVLVAPELRAVRLLSSRVTMSTDGRDFVAHVMVRTPFVGVVGRTSREDSATRRASNARGHGTEH